MVGHNQGTNLLDFGANPDQDPDTGIYGRNFTTVVLAVVKAPHCGSATVPKYTG